MGRSSPSSRRAPRTRAGAADGVNLLTFHRAKGLEWDAVFLPALEEGNLPIRQALDDDEALAEERRLLYVGLTRARTHLALRGRSVARPAGARPGARRAGSCSTSGRGRHPVGSASCPGRRGRRRPARPAGADNDDPVFAALREWRTGVARDEAMPPYVIAHDATLAAIAEARPRSLAALRRVKGMGPAKLERYGDEILAVLERTADGDPA